MATNNCLTLVEDDSRSLCVSFLTEHPGELQRLLGNIRNDLTVQQLVVRDINAAQRHNLVHLALAIRSHPTISRIKFEESAIQNFGPLFIAIAKDPLPALEFHNCVIHDDAVNDLNILLFAGKGTIQELLFEACVFSSSGGEQAFGSAIRANQSLRSFSFFCDIQCPSRFTESVNHMIEHNGNFETFGLAIDDSKFESAPFFRCIEASQSLKCLRIRQQGSGITLATIERIMLMCFATESVRELDFTGCIFQAEAFYYLLRTLSKRTMIQTLNISSFSQVADDPAFSVSKMSRQVAKLQVNRLILSSNANFMSDSLLQEIDNAGFIHHLDFSDYSDVFFSHYISDFLDGESLKKTVELILDPEPKFKASPAAEKELGGGLKSITLRPKEASNLFHIVRGFDYGCVRKLTFGRFSFDITAQLLSTLCCYVTESDLCSVSFQGGISTPISDDMRDQLNELRGDLAVNRVGHFYLVQYEGHVPAGLWARVIARSSCDPDGIFFALTEKPEIAGFNLDTAVGNEDNDDDETMLDGTATSNSPEEDIMSRPGKRTRQLEEAQLN
jgi:hypothetical protein